MALKRLKPLINQRDLGYVRLWQGELAEIVRLMRQLNEAEVHIEADDYVVDDIETDLPKIGSQRVKSFKAIATRTVGDEPSREVMKIELTTGRSQIEATDPDLSTLGAMEAIVSLTDRCRRIPAGWLTKIFGFLSGTGLGGLIFFSLVVSGAIWLIGLVAATAIAPAASHSSAAGGHRQLVITLQPVQVIWDAVAALLCVGMLTGFIRARTVMYTGTRAEAPTWWQEHRSDVAINVAVSILFFLLGILVGHL